MPASLRKAPPVVRPEVRNDNEIPLSLERRKWIGVEKQTGAARSEARTRQIYDGVLETLFRQKPVTDDVVRDFTQMARAEFRQTANGLRKAFEDFVPTVFAEGIPGDAAFASGFEALQGTLQAHDMTRETFDRRAERIFDRSLKGLAEAIRRREVGGVAPVVFYSPGMKARLIRYIQVVQQGFESIGDVTGEHYRITLVSENKAELMKLKTELSKSGMLRGVHFIEKKGSEGTSKELDAAVLRHPVFGNQFGVFFPEEAIAQKIPAWQRVVRAEIPREYAILLLPELSLYFSKTATSDINAMTLRRALPDLFASAAFRVGQGIAIVAAFLEHVAAAERQLSVSA